MCVCSSAVTVCVGRNLGGRIASHMVEMKKPPRASLASHTYSMAAACPTPPSPSLALCPAPSFTATKRRREAAAPA